MLTLTKTAADKLADHLTIGDSVQQRDVDGTRTYHVQHAPIISVGGQIVDYHSDLYVVAVAGSDGVVNII